MKKLTVFLVAIAMTGFLSAQETGCTEGNCNNGKGTYLYTNGYTYTGHFINGVREGRGILTSPEGETYDGMWVDDQFEGQGTYIWSSGDKYTGAWKNGIREGYGIYFYVNGDKYKGYFKNNQFHGKGTYIWKDGTSQEGIYKNGKPVEKTE